MEVVTKTKLEVGPQLYLIKMKNNLQCNLLIADEIFDAALDEDGIHCLTEIFEELENENVIIISHREQSREMFDRVLEFKKVGNFSTMSVID